MKITSPGSLLLLLATLSPSLSLLRAQETTAPPSKAPIIIASVQLNRISSQIGYPEIAVLGAPEELKLKLREITKEEKAAQSKILSVKEEGDMQKLQVELRVIAEKKRLFMQFFQTSGSGRNQQRQWKEFIQAKFSEKYPIILNGDFSNSFSNSSNMVSFRAETKDITDEVIAALQNELSGE